jgi:hypothetical protein
MVAICAELMRRIWAASHFELRTLGCVPKFLEAIYLVHSEEVPSCPCFIIIFDDAEFVLTSDEY